MVEGPYCDGCPQQAIGGRRLSPDGRGASGILIVGDSPWKDEIRVGRPFAGAAGSYLERLIHMIERRRDDFIITNTMCCKPPSLGWTDREEAQPAIMQCSPYLDETIRERKPKVIIPLGNVALRRCCGVSGIQARQAYIHDSVWGIPAVPTFHPSFILQGNHKYFGAAAYAFRRAEEIASGSFKRLGTHYLIDAPVHDLDAYCAEFDCARQPVAVDIETPTSAMVDEEEAEESDPSYTIVRVSFSASPGTAVTFPWSEPYISWFRANLPKWPLLTMWNEAFDAPRLIANGAMINGQIIDAMWMWHWLQSDLPKALGFVAPFFTDLPCWKHLASSDLPLYSAMDSDATIRCYFGIRTAIEKQRRWKGFEQHCLKTGSVLRKWGPRGILINKERQGLLKAKLEGEHAKALADLQTLVPEAVKRVKTWKKGPKVVTSAHRTEEVTCEACQGTGLKAPKQPRVKKPKPCSPCKGTGTVTKYSLVQDFNPHSSDQVLALMRDMGLKIPMKRGENRETTEAKYLKRYAKKHPVFKTILDCREKQKAISNYIYVLKPISGCDIISPDAKGQREPETVEGAVQTNSGSTQAREASQQSNLGTGVQKEAEGGQKTVLGVHECGGTYQLLEGAVQEVRSPISSQGEDHKTLAESQVQCRGTKAGSPEVGVRGNGTDSVEGGRRDLPAVQENRQTTLHTPYRHEQEEQLKRESHGAVHDMPQSIPCSHNEARPKVLPSAQYTSANFGRVVTEFGFHPSTWRKSSRNTNLQTIPVRNHDLAEAIRATMVASPGHVLVEADYEGIEAVIVGVCAGDPDYIRICKAGLHGFTASHWMGNPIDRNLPFDELRKLCKAIKKSNPAEYDRSKRGNHGVNYLLSAYGLNDEWPEVFPKRKDAQAYIDFYFDLFKSIRIWHNQQLRLASKQTFLDNHYGGRHYFYHVLVPDKVTGWDDPRFGEDAKRSIAYVPQSDASCIQNLDMLEINADPITEPLGRLVIHDSFVFDCPLELVDYLCSKLSVLMSRPRPELGGVSIGVEISIGEDLRKDNMSVWHTPSLEALAIPNAKPNGGSTSLVSAVDGPNTTVSGVSPTST